MALKTLFSFNFDALGSSNEIQIYHESSEVAESIASKAIEEIRAIETKYSRYRSDSIISQINSSAGESPIDVDPETASLLDYATACYKTSNGLFDITSGILRKVWNFKGSKIPEQSEIEKLLPLIGWEKVEWNSPSIFLKEKGMELDFGGIGKEYAVDKAAAVLLENSVTSTLINLGGDIRVLGPQPDGKPWKIGIQHPRENSETISSVEISYGAITTSGDYERYIEIDGNRYSHILNPKTGWPLEGFQSVTLIAESCLVSGSLCTIAMLKGEKEGLEFLKNCKRKFLIVSKNGVVLSFV